VKKTSKIILFLTVLLLAGWQTDKVSRILAGSVYIDNSPDRIEYISGKLLGTPYVRNTLGGSPDEQEKLVINLDGMDCFTFLDYVEAMRLSGNVNDFIPNLKKVRYFNSEVQYSKRKHFFSDWISGENNTVKDITPDMPGSVTVEKLINRKSASESWLKNVPQTMRMVTFLPTEKIDKNTIEMFQTGDYIGSFSESDGLDVTHTGIFIRNKNGIFYRNATTKDGHNDIADYPFEKYIKEVKGIIIYRPI